MGVSPAFWPILVFVFANGVADAVTIVADQGIKQRRTPDAVRSRVMAASEAVWQITLALGYVLSGVVLALTARRASTWSPASAPAARDRHAPADAAERTGAKRWSAWPVEG